ncbi:VOC family protein [Chthonobacter rhizosphaerae]|uniref:VOC family protein n=1 Tax=Chthonobacter rhizosphaerae TaxID=2735553 RepID=UPI0015EFAD33|nr:VOC family protein [Chthonobacter rhizosphaerae]
MAAPKLNAVVETGLYVDDLDRARAFYEGTLGLRHIFGDDRMAALDVGGRSVLLLFRRGESLAPIDTPGGSIPPHDGSGPLHFALAIARDDLEAWERYLDETGVPIEGRTHWPKGGVSLYFRDPDNHLVEIATPGLWDIY